MIDGKLNMKNNPTELRTHLSIAKKNNPHTMMAASLIHLLQALGNSFLLIHLRPSRHGPSPSWHAPLSSQTIKGHPSHVSYPWLRLLKLEALDHLSSPFCCPRYTLAVP
ncbi:hypothetical protein GOP47_0002196 [Adiantum capillus-veneris]|uniref:Uncharacterized protein n=1 Tax=Adiantum capillus-veneris TaxID=13818 RepID=A0A9D4VA64_ADICA|nr:hypothetical protein GOP47_0002196 [Adiantum capillus-veneris]